MTDPMWAAIDELHERINKLEAQLTTPEQPVDAFDEFWALYPRKVGKPLARKAFAKVTAAAAIEGLEAWLEVAAFAPVEKYRPHASTWLNQKCYNDDPVPYQTFQKPQISNGTKSETRKALDKWLDD